MIRKAHPDDFDAILEMSELFWESTIYDEKFDKDHTRKMIEMAYEHGLLAVLDKDKPVGFIAGVKAPLLASTDALIGSELAFWINPEHRKGRSSILLIKYMEELVALQKIKHWTMISMESSSPEVAERIYLKLGYKKAETSFVKEII